MKMDEKMHYLRSRGLYYSDKLRQFAHVAVPTDLDSPDINKWKVIIGGDFTPCPERRMKWSTFNTWNDLSTFLKNQDFFKCNKNIILVSVSQASTLENDTFFWERVSAVFGPDTFTVVRYPEDGFSVAGLHQLGIWRSDYHWIWYGTTVDPALEVWLEAQIIEEVTTLAFKAEKYAYDDVYQDRVVQVSRIFYQFDEDGNLDKQLFQTTNGMMIEF